MSSYYLQLGSTPDLSYRELTSVFGEKKVSPVSTYFAQVDVEDSITPSMLVNQLGGVVKVLQPVSTLNAQVTESELIAQITALLIEQAGEANRINYNLAEHNRDHLPEISATEIKKALMERGLSARYREGSRHGLSAAILIHQRNHTELQVIQTDQSILLALTAAAQDIDDWTTRDRLKPYADRKKGMLPPKVARMMVNIGRGSWQQLTTQTAIEPVIYDPFCGSGTILMEAALLGSHVLGSDLDAAATQGTQQNLSWLAKTYTIPVSAQVVTGDVTKIQPGQLKKAVNVIVTEPFLGKPLPKPQDLPNIFKGLEKMYWGAFKHWPQLLAEQAVIVMVLPLVEDAHHRYDFASFIDKIKPLGYTMMSEPVLYHRPQAVVQRQIHIFTYEKPSNS